MFALWACPHTDQSASWGLGDVLPDGHSFPSCPQIRLCSIRPRRKLEPRTLQTRLTQHQLPGRPGAPRPLQLCHPRGRCRSSPRVLSSGDGALPARRPRCWGPRSFVSATEGTRWGLRDRTLKSRPLESGGAHAFRHDLHRGGAAVAVRWEHWHRLCCCMGKARGGFVSVSLWLSTSGSAENPGSSPLGRPWGPGPGVPRPAACLRTYPD